MKRGAVGAEPKTQGSQRGPSQPPSASPVLDLQRVAGNRAVRQLLQAKTAAARTLKAGETLEVQSAPVQHARAWNGRFAIKADGKLDFGGFPVAVAGLTLQQAAERLARCLVEHEILVQPTVKVTAGGDSATATYKAPQSPTHALRQKFEDYVKGLDPHSPAVARYLQWLNEHDNVYELGLMTPEQLWGLALIEPGARTSPREKQLDSFRNFERFQVQDDQASLKAKPKDWKEAVLRVEALKRFEAWVERNRDTAAFLKADPGVVYHKFAAELRRAAGKEEFAEQLAKKKYEQLHPYDSASPEDINKKLDEFVTYAKRLFGYEARRYPYTIHLDKHTDILFMGDPAMQQVLDRAGHDIIHWAVEHMMDSDFTRLDARKVSEEILGTHWKELNDAQQHPEEHEYAKREVDKELKGRSFLASFGDAVFRTVTVVALVGAVVGAEIITAGQATWIFAALATTSGAQSYMQRRNEIEAGNYDVPVLDTLVYSIGDVVMLSQVIEGITGERLGTHMELSGEERSETLGDAAGSAFGMFTGSRAWHAGESFGMRVRPSRPGIKPPGPEGRTRGTKARGEYGPVKPKPYEKPGPLERQARDGLPKELKSGLDLWVADLRVKGVDVEKVLKGKNAKAIEQSAASFQRRYDARVKLAEEHRHLRERSKDDPLRPTLKKNFNVAGTDVWVRYEKSPPSAREVEQAVRLSMETGEPVDIFGDTASNIAYPAIDGTIGAKRRPMQLKRLDDASNLPSDVRRVAENAAETAKTHGYSQVEVYIDAPHLALADIKAAWEQGTGKPYDGSVVAKIVVKAKDGRWQPPKSKPQTVARPPKLPDNDKRKEKAVP